MSTRKPVPSLGAWLAGCIAVLALMPALSSAALADNDEVRMGGDITISSRGGGLVVIGGDITVDSPRTGDLALMGGDIKINSTIAGDAGITGGDVTVAGRVDGDMGVAAGDFSLEKGARIGKDLGVAAGHVVIAGSVGGDAGIAAGSVTVTGSITGKVEIRASDVTISDGAHIGGKLVVKGPNEPKIAGGARIEGGWEHIYAPPGAIFIDDLVVHGGLFALVAIGLASMLLLAPIALVFGLLFIFALTQFSDRTVQAFHARPITSFVTGFLVVSLLPFAIVLLLVTVIGIPLALVLAPLYPLWLVLGFVGGALGLSRVFNKHAEISRGMQLLYLFAALIVIGLVWLIPFAGWLAVSILFFMGTGALTLALFQKNGAGKVQAA